MANKTVVFDGDAIDGTDGLGYGVEGVEVGENGLFIRCRYVETCKILAQCPFLQSLQRGKFVETIAVIFKSLFFEEILEPPL